MLNLSQIESFYPENLRVNQRSLLREYLTIPLSTFTLVIVIIE